MHKILIGTSKGLVIFQKQNDNWQISETHFLGMPISMLFVDERNNAWWAGISHRHWGQKLHFSEDEGRSWNIVPMPKYPAGTEIKNGKAATLKKIWCMNQAGFDNPNSLWLGTEPGGLFNSSDGGKSFQLNQNLWNHPSRLNEHEWFGAGRDFPFIHSIVIDPRDSKHIYIAVSCAGIFETKDGGITWTPRNKGLIAVYLPNPQAEVGHDPHLLLACKSNPDVLWQQNHCGIFRSENGGVLWENVSDKNGIANYGFALAIDHQNDKKAWVIPAVSDEIRVAPNNALCVCRTKDGGKTWETLRNGLPQKDCFDIVFRHSFAKKDKILVFGTTTGNVYLSENEGDKWQCLTNNLARVESVVFAG